MNQYAIALAADSASTVRGWVNGKEETRYFKGANKIFQLSNYHPVGVMIYGPASLQHVPWEIIVKDFRNSLQKRSFHDLKAYGSEFFDFIKGHVQLFPKDYLHKTFVNEAVRVATMKFFQLSREESYQEAEGDDAKAAELRRLLESELSTLREKQLHPAFQEADVVSATSAYSADVESQLKTNNIVEDETVHFNQWAEFGIVSLYRDFKSHLSSTGVVIAGFGDHDYFPGFVEYDCYGMLLGSFLVEEKGVKQLDHDTPAEFKTFAISNMIQTFQMGFSQDVFEFVNSQFAKSLVSFEQELNKQVAVPAPVDSSAMREKVFEEFQKNWVYQSFDVHYRPLMRIIGSLPVDQMADLAETLVSLESLKERVTQPSESVGGPIDVAVITKGDGFVWVKRKHYFKPELNPRYFLRQRDVFKL